MAAEFPHKTYALISVSDKEGIVPFARGMAELGYSILATGNTAIHLLAAGIECTQVSALTGFPEIFGGRVKTLHPAIFGGILRRDDNPADTAEAEENHIPRISVVCVNLYPFEKTASSAAASPEELISNIDIGGPSLLRASAKNHQDVLVLTSPSQYATVLNALRSGSAGIQLRRELAVAAFSHTARYDAVISTVLAERFEAAQKPFALGFESGTPLRYGENPHQQAWLYGTFLQHFSFLHGKGLSYNNILDIHAGFGLISRLPAESAVIVKHNNPCGAAVAPSLAESYGKALACDPVSAFGGIVFLRGTVDEPLAATLNELFLEVVVAGGYTDPALAILRKKKDRRLLQAKSFSMPPGREVRSVLGGVLVQDADNAVIAPEQCTPVTVKAPTPDELRELLFAWEVVTALRSNAIVLAKNGMAIGTGGGQVSRIDSVTIALMKAARHGHIVSGSVCASDAFFPFKDTLEELAAAGITAVIQPGGSVRDEEVINAANSAGISMVFTGIRHFKH